MFKAFDDNNEEVFAVHATKSTTYYCPVCKAKVKLRKGEKNAPHFAHDPKQPCPYKEDRDYMSEWHVRMQNYFPPESRECYFRDCETGEIHRADVFLEDSNTVIEFQKSPMTSEEFNSRTNFHLKEGRRIAWIFDESKDNPKPGDLGKLRPISNCCEYPHEDSSFKWLYHRKCLPCEGNPLDIRMYNPLSNYAVFIYTGAEDGDCIHRIISEDFDYEEIVLSIAQIRMSHDLDSDDLFRDEEDVIARSDIRGSVYEYREEKRMRIELMREEREASRRQGINATFDEILRRYAARNRRW